MANREHLAMLKKAVTARNERRELNPDTRPDLSGADLSRADLTRASLQGATLRGADPVEADLCQATLFEADFRGADLSRAYLVLADFSDAGLAKANTENTDLRYSQLIACNLTQTALTGAKLYGTARDDWFIEGIECRYVFWDHCGGIRSPKDRDFRPGEFEQIDKALPTIEYVFQNGMTPLDPPGYGPGSSGHSGAESGVRHQDRFDKCASKDLGPVVVNTAAYGFFKSCLG